MKIVCIISPYYDYLTATLIEGLHELGHKIVASENSNYATKSSNRKIRSEAERADLVVVCSNSKVRTWLVEDIDNPNNIYIDGSDSQELRIPSNIRFKLIFKRELNKYCKIKTLPLIYPLQFAAERRYFQAMNAKRDLRVSFAANLHNNTMRYSVYQRLLNREDVTIFCGNTGERAYDPSKKKGHPIDTPKYRDILYRSQIAVSVAGAGYDCARHWEIPASGALLLTQELDIRVPHPFTNGINCVTFGTADEFNEKLDVLLSKPSLVEQIATAGHEHLVRYHTTKERASYFIDIAAKHSDINKYCDSFYTGKRRPNKARRIFNFISKINISRPKKADTLTRYPFKKETQRYDEASHPERLVLLPYCTNGRGIDVGCGHRKTHDNCIGIDIIPRDTKGLYGCVNGKPSQADICTSGDNLSIFANRELDFVVSRHNLEHYIDVIKTLTEWKRVLRIGGMLAMVLPDERYLDTIRLDPTHKHVFTPESIARYLNLIGGFEIIKNDVVIERWSFVCVARRIDAA